MKNNYILYLLLPLLILFSCNVNNRNKAIKLISEFEHEKSVDKRETVFNIDVIFENGKLVLQGETDSKKLKTELLAKLSKLKPSDRITVLPNSTVGNKIYGLINLSVANLRSAPRHSAELSTQALLGTPVKILKREGGWYLIQTPDKYISWVDGAGIKPLTTEQITEWRHSKRIIFTADNGLVYKTTAFKFPVSDVTMGNILEETGRNNYSVEVRFPDGRKGFTSPGNWTDFNKFRNSTSPDSTKLRQMSLHFLGRPYLWGGTSARAMDCSGFVKTVYFMNGLVLPRDASQQARFGRPVDTNTDYSNLKTGDLLFFGKAATDESAERITHVAMSLGNTEYINEAGRMKLNSFDPASPDFSEYRKNTFIRAKRIIGTTDAKNTLLLKNHSWY